MKIIKYMKKLINLIIIAKSRENIEFQLKTIIIKRKQNLGTHLKNVIANIKKTNI